jgi:HEAT repeat protein
MPLNSQKSTVVSRQSPVGILILVLYVVSGFSRTVVAQQYTFEEVASGLKHKDAATRLRAIQILRDADYSEAAGPIAAALEDSDDRVQLAAIDAERSLFTTRVVPRRKKVGFIVEVRRVAGGDAAAAGQLALKARTIPPPLLKSLAAVLRDDNPRVRAEAIALAALLGPSACPPLPTVERGANPCAEIGNALVDNINSREPLIRRTAMHALGQLRYSNAVQALSDRLSYHQRGIDAMAALEALAGIGHPTSASIFEELLSSSDADTRRYAVEGLARVGNRDALAMLHQMGQGERSNGVLLALHYANVKLMPETELTSCTAGDPGTQCLGFSSLQTLITALGIASQRPVALNYLLDIAPSMAPALSRSLGDESADVRRLVADVLGFSRDRSIIPALEAAAKDSDPDVAAAARQAIERLNL